MTRGRTAEPRALRGGFSRPASVSKSSCPALDRQSLLSLDLMHCIEWKYDILLFFNMQHIL